MLKVRYTDELPKDLETWLKEVLAKEREKLLFPGFPVKAIEEFEPTKRELSFLIRNGKPVAFGAWLTEGEASEYEWAYSVEKGNLLQTYFHISELYEKSKNGEVYITAFESNTDSVSPVSKFSEVANRGFWLFKTFPVAVRRNPFPFKREGVIYNGLHLYIIPPKGVNSLSFAFRKSIEYGIPYALIEVPEKTEKSFPFVGFKVVFQKLLKYKRLLEKLIKTAPANTFILRYNPY